MTDKESGVSDTIDLLRETIVELELAMESIGWDSVTTDSAFEFSRSALHTIARQSKLYYLKNPLVQRGVNVQRDYVFGRGVTIRSDVPEVNEIVQAFLTDAKNKAELTSHQALLGKEVELAVTGNIFFVLFSLPDGRVRVRTINADEIEDIITDPEDSKSPWFYKRSWTKVAFNVADGQLKSASKVEYYPDWRYQPAAKPNTIGSIVVNWNAPVYHVKVGGLPDMKFGVPETFAALDWAKAYKLFLEDWSTIVRAYARFAWQVNVKGGKDKLAAAKTKLNSRLPADETNPAPTTGATFVAGDGSNLTPVRTAGATTSAEDGRRLLLMVAATLGLPESFFGDVSVGTLATAKSLDRPTELKFRSRQTLWSDVLSSILTYAVYCAVKSKKLPGKVVEEDDGTPRIELYLVDVKGEPAKPSIKVEFPEVVEPDPGQNVASIIDAATLKGGVLAGVIDQMTVSRLLLTALGVDDVDATMSKIYPDDGNAVETDEGNTEEEQVFEAVRNVSAMLASLKEAIGGKSA